ncbi:MAG: hypothetical protein C0621_05220 [Desulfuromonas sp.]|nr:MAG: hypothetical protein C0621_05220 [Desulfuromonas sp.]
MIAEENVALDCPSCGAEIYAPLSWFKKEYGTCPHCDGGVAAGQFATRLAEIEEAFDAHIDEMLQPEPSCGCGATATTGSCCHAAPDEE